MATSGIDRDSEPDPRERLRQHFLETNSPQKWDELWKEGFLPWDRGTPNPALIDVLETKKDILGDSMVVDKGGKKRRKKALVPGCGKGYDVYLFAAFGYDAYGLDGSKHALEACEAFRGEADTKEEYKVRNEESGKGEVKFLYGDFFSHDWEKEAGGAGFDVIYDYTVCMPTNPCITSAHILDSFSALCLPLHDLLGLFACPIFSLLLGA
jgi:SAM-dependent methyltransferase